MRSTNLWMQGKSQRTRTHFWLKLFQSEFSSCALLRSNPCLLMIVNTVYFTIVFDLPVGLVIFLLDRPPFGLPAQHANLRPFGQRCTWYILMESETRIRLSGANCPNLPQETWTDGKHSIRANRMATVSLLKLSDTFGCHYERHLSKLHSVIRVSAVDRVQTESEMTNMHQCDLLWERNLSFVLPEYKDDRSLVYSQWNL